MYATASARETRQHVLLDAIGEIQLGALVINGPDGLVASHLPMTIAQAKSGICLQCHVARANPLWEQASAGCAAMVIFQGPHAYVHPRWMSSAEDQTAAVPTWTYIAVHVHGRLQVVHDEDWLRRHLGELALNNEAQRPNPWSPSDLPESRMRQLLPGIIGLELSVERMEGSWKLAQALARPERLRIAAALETSGQPREKEVARVMQALLRDEQART